MINIPKLNIEQEKWVDNKLLSGKNLAIEIKNYLTERVREENIKPGLAVLIVGEDEASKIYVRNKEKSALKIGFHSVVKTMPADTSEKDILQILNNWNNDDSIHGILTQLPLPKHLDTQKIVQAIVPEKDADGFHFENMGRLVATQQGTVACTPLGIAIMLKNLDVDLTGKNAVVLGRSTIVGKPMASLLMDVFQCTTTVCHSRTKNIQQYVEQADVLVAAMGVRDIVSSSWIKKNAIVIDVGMHRVDGKLAGDLDYKDIIETASFVTPVPGGVGPMTIAMLLYNTFQNAMNILKKQ